MDNNLQIFQNSNFGEIRTIQINNEIWFVGKDVAKALGYERTADAIRTHVDVDDKGVGKIQTPGGSQEMTIINESGLYSLILSSKLPQAKEFKRWVTSEILPSIHKHGGYLTPEKLEEALLNPDTLIKLATNLKQEQEKNIELTLVNKQQQELIEKQQPKVLFAEAVETSETSILVGELAKILKQKGFNIGQNKLFELLRKDGYLMKQGSSKNMPTQKAMDMGLFEIKESIVAQPNGTTRVTKTPKVTGKGQVYFVNKYLKDTEIQKEAI
ncbi:MAG: phage antirepressor [Eubacteriales bacterium]|nr:phage antirepressor [Eubacteriales bacterium]